MPIKTKIPGETHQYTYSPGTDTVQNFDKVNRENNTVPQLNNASGLKQYAEDLANQSDGMFTSDDMKYAIATTTAQDRLGDLEGVDKQRLKDEIDNIYENELGASNTGREVRGENRFTDIVGGLKDFTDNLNKNIGYGMDWLWDTGVGFIGDQFGVGDQARNMFTGEDLAIVPDILEDIAATALLPGPLGIAAVAAKNAVQQSDNIASAISGKDIITQDDLDGTQQLGKGLEALGAIGLSSLGGIGKTANIAKFGKELNASSLDAVKKAAADNAKGIKTVLPAEKMSQSVVSKVAREKPELLEESVLQSIKDGKKAGIPTKMLDRRLYQLKNAREAARESMKPGDPKKIKRINSKIDKNKKYLEKAELDGDTNKVKQIEEALKKHQDELYDTQQHPLDALRAWKVGFTDAANSKNVSALRDQVADLKRSAKKAAKIESKGKDVDKYGRIKSAALGAVPRLKKTGATMATMGPMMLVSEMADNGGNIQDSIANITERLGSEVSRGHIGPALLTAFPFGTYKAGRKIPNVKGNYTGTWGQPTARAAGYANNLTEDYSYMPEAYDEDELFERLKLAKEHNNG